MEVLEARINEIHKSIITTIDVRDRLEEIALQVKDKDDFLDVKEAADVLTDKITDWQAFVIELRQKNFQDVLNWPAGLNSEYFMLRNNLDTYDPSVPEGYKDRQADLDSQWAAHQRSWTLSCMKTSRVSTH